jgi:hypothetical protein
MGPPAGLSCTVTSQCQPSLSHTCAGAGTALKSQVRLEGFLHWSTLVHDAEVDLC